MTPERWLQVKAIVQAALARPAPARAAFVVEACGNDVALRAEVESLLSGPDTGEDSNNFLASPAGIWAIAAAAVGARATGAHSEGASWSTGTAGAAEAAREADVAAAQSAALSEALAGRYELERTLGRGGMATVYLARDLRHRRLVALKVLHPALGALLGPRRFLREIETAANLSHPHILPLHDSGRVPVGESAAGEDDVLLYYVMPYVSGESLRARLRREGRLAVPDALGVVREVAAALDYAHRHGVVHRDVKPENILLDEDGHALVADFGIARADRHDGAGADGSALAGGSDTITELGRVIGTPAYMSPEQARGRRDLEGRSDQYSLACVAFELLAGAAPFAGTSAEQFAARPTQAPASLVERRPDLPPAADAVLARALALAPEARFDTTSAFAEALAASIFDVVSPHGRTPGTALDSSKPESVRPSRRRTLTVAAGLAAGVAIVATLLVRGTPPRAPPAPSGPPVLAVLPFENLGPPSDAYFADGLTDELTGRLAALSGLRVIAGASARKYKGSKKEPRAIARELGATHLLTGTVRWERTADADGAAGTERVRVRPELVRASDHVTVWTEPVEGSLEDVFLVQANVAERVAASLHVALLARERRAAAAPPTRSLAAYDAYLRALAVLGNGHISSATARRAAAAELERAVALDPVFVAAHAKLAAVYGGIHRITGDPVVLAQARVSAERAWALDSTAVDSRHIRVAYLLWAGDLEGAHRAASAFVAAAPGVAVAHDQLGAVEDALDHVDASIKSYQRAATLDPRAPGPVERIASLNQRAYRYAESVRYRERHLALEPQNETSYWMYMLCYLGWRADTAAARRVADRGGPGLAGVLVRLPNDGGMAALWHQVVGPAVWRARDTLSLAGYSAGDGGLPPELYLLMKLRHFALTGRPDRMRAYADSAIAQLAPALRRAPDVTLYQTYSRRVILAEAYARLGRAAQARREIDRYVAEVRAGPRPSAVPNALVNAAYVDVLSGRHDEAVTRLSEALRLPGGIFISRALLHADASWAPLRGHPGFERLFTGDEGGRPRRQ
jgi:serine/threonine-protein kinase